MGSMVHVGMTMRVEIGNSLLYIVHDMRVIFGHGGMALIGVIGNSLLYSVGDR